MSAGCLHDLDDPLFDSVVFDADCFDESGAYEQIPGYGAEQLLQEQPVHYVVPLSLQLVDAEYLVYLVEDAEVPGESIALERDGYFESSSRCFVFG